MSAPIFQSTITNTSGSRKYFSYLPQHGVTLAAGESVTYDGDIYSWLQGRRLNRFYYDLLNDVQQGNINVELTTDERMLSTDNTWDGEQSFENIKWPGSSGSGYWNDLRIVADATTAAGANSPVFGIFANDGADGTDHAISFEGTNSYGVVPDYAGLDTGTGNYSVSVWVYPDDVNRTILYRQGFLELKLNTQNQLTIALGAVTATVSGSLFPLDQWQLLTVTFTAVNPTRTTVRVYIDGSQITTFDMFSSFPASASQLYVGSRAGTSYLWSGFLDQLWIFNVVLSAAQVAEIYNSGAGRTALPTGITEATQVVAKFEFNENTGSTVDNDCTLGAGQDMALQGDFTWVPGRVGVSPSRGVGGWAFSPSKLMELFFRVQFPHSWTYQTNIRPHLHFSIKEPGTLGQTISWGIEYTWQALGAEYPNTQTIYTETLIGEDTEGDGTIVPRRHYLAALPEIDGSSILSVSSMIKGRIFRNPEGLGGQTDDYPHLAWFDELDFHILSDSPGSREEFSKT